MDEFELIESIKARFAVPVGVTGIGDDCAVIPQTTGFDTLVSTDLLVEGVHFLLGDIAPELLGWKSAAVNFSDIAAMGGSPVGTFLSIALPADLPEGWVTMFIKGYKELSDLSGAPLLGGDTTSSPNGLNINVTVLGSCRHGCSKLRSAAADGDLICTTGCLGDSAAGLHAILHGIDCEYLKRKHYRPVPRLEEGKYLASLEGVHAMMDISDGIGSDLQHILDASGKGAVVDTACLPISGELSSYCRDNGLDPSDFAIDGGEDYELLFTVEPGTELAIPHFVIGRICSGSGISWLGSEKAHKGFRHF